MCKRKPKVSKSMCPCLVVRTIKWLTKVTRRFFWMASTRVRSIEAAVRELVRSEAPGVTVASKRWLDEDDIATVIIFSSIGLQKFL